jgi:hypothetical protein
MTSYNYIINPDTSRKVSIFSTKGKSILKNYLIQSGGEYDGRCKGHTECPPPEGCKTQKIKAHTRTSKKTGKVTQVKARTQCTPDKSIRNARKKSTRPRRSSSRSHSDNRSYCNSYDENDCRSHSSDCLWNEPRERFNKKTGKSSHVKAHCRTKPHGRGESNPLRHLANLDDDELRNMVPDRHLSRRGDKYGGGRSRRFNFGFE